MRPHLAKVLQMNESQVPSPSSQNTVTIGVGHVPAGTSLEGDYITASGFAVQTPDSTGPQGNQINLYQQGAANGNNQIYIEAGAARAGTYLVTCYVDTSAASVPYELRALGVGHVDASAPVQNGVIMMPFLLSKDTFSLTLSLPLDASYPTGGYLSFYSCDFMKAA